MGQLLLIRHGQASFGADDYDALSPLGFEQARLLGASLAARHIEAGTIVGGGMRRHRETALTCAEAAGWTAGDLVVDQGWDEFDFLAVLAARPTQHAGPEPTKAEFQRWFEEATAAWIAGEDLPFEESFLEFTTRVDEALARTVELAADGTVAVFTSGGPVGWAVSSVLTDGGSSELWTRLNRMTVNSGLTRLVAGSRGVNLLAYNEQSHLDSVPGTLSYR